MSSSNPNNRLPALSPPPGVTSNFVNPYSLSPVFVVTAVLCLSLATIAVVVRLAVAFYGSTGGMRVEDCTFAFFSGLDVVKASADRTRFLRYFMGM